MLKDQVAAFLDGQAREHEAFTVGARFGHLLVDAQNLTAIEFDGDNGLESLLEYMERSGWEAIFEDEAMIGVRKYPATVLLQAGGQLELQVEKTANLQVIDKTYLDFIQGLFDELKSRGQLLLATGYQPVTKAEDIALVPMVKYQDLAKYLADNKAALEQMKGSASISVAIDYAHSDDFEKKYRIAVALSPVFSALFDNVGMWGGEDYTAYNGNRSLRNNGDQTRGDVPGVLGKNSYKYAQYAGYVAGMPAVAVANGEEILYVGAKTNGEVFADKTVSDDEISGMLNMSNADVRVTDQGIEFNMVDSLPYPLNMAYITLVKGLFYNMDHLDALYDLVQNMTMVDIAQAKRDIVEKGMEAKFGEGTVRDIAKDLYFMVGPTVEPAEQHYLQPMEAVIFKMIYPKDVTKRQLRAMLD